MDGSVPELFRKLKERYPDILENYDRLAASVRSIQGLDNRSQRLVKLGIAIGARLEGAVHSHARKCRAAGLSDGELYHAGLLAITTVGWPAAAASLSWIDDVLKGIGREG